MNRLACFVLVAGAVACSGTSGSRDTTGRGAAGRRNDPRAEPMPHQSCADAGGEVQALDVNGDGRPDIRTVMRGGHAYCRESDANFDGRVDIVRFFDDQGRPTRVEDDYDFDGRVDVVAIYQNGVIESDVLDTNFDGRTDTWRDYRNGHVVELRRDANSDGRVDTWERFDESSRLIYAAVDSNGDGRPDDVTDGGTASSAATSPGASSAAPASPAAPASLADGGTTGGSTASGMGGTAPPPTTPAAGGAR
jgi:hypothetical protein